MLYMVVFHDAPVDKQLIQCLHILCAQGKCHHIDLSYKVKTSYLAHSGCEHPNGHIDTRLLEHVIHVGKSSGQNACLPNTRYLHSVCCWKWQGWCDRQCWFPGRCWDHRDLGP